MAERHDERRHAGPIVPDPTASLSAHRLRQPRAPRLWPLWLLLLLLLAAMAGAGYLAWEERERLSREVERLQGELSNVHARFDATLGKGESLEAMEARLVALERRDEAHDGLLAVLEEDLGERDERLAALQERVMRIGESAATREAMLAATQLSLDALERSGAEGRAALASAIEGVEASVDGQEEVHRRHAERLDTLEAGLAALTEESVANDALEALAAEQEALAQRLRRVEEQGPASIAHLEERLAALGGELEALAEARDDEAQEDDALVARFAALEGEIGELRRTQLALSARLEALRP